MDEIADFDILDNNYAELVNKSPIAKYRKIRANLSFGGIAFRN